MASVLLVLHVSMLKKCVIDPDSVLLIEGLVVKDNLSYKEIPIQILDRQVYMLRNKEVVPVKVLWNNHLVKGATWEAKADMKSHYPYIFYN